MRKSMTADLMPSMIERAHLLAVDHAPILVHLTQDAGDDVERPARAVLLEDRGAVGEGRVGNIVESKTDQRRRVVHGERLRARVPRRLTKNSLDQRLEHDAP